MLTRLRRRLRPPTDRPARPLSWWLVTGYGMAAVVVGAAVTWWIWLDDVGTAAERATIEIQTAIYE